MDTSHTHRVRAVTSVFLFTFALSMIGGPLQAGTVDSSPDLTAEVRALRDRLDAQQQLLDAQRQQIDSLQQDRDSDWLTERRREQVKTLVRDVLSDADTRASLAEGGMTAGYRKGFFLASDDGNFLLRIKGMIQARYVFDHQEDTADASGDDNRGGFELSRTRFGFIGHVFDESWNYVIWTGYNRNGDNAFLDTYIRKDLGGGWSITAGQFKLPFYREYLVSEKSQQFVERSLVTYGFSCGYSQGIMLTYGNDSLKASAAYTDGRGQGNTAWSNEDTEWSITGRADVKLTGDWKQYGDFESWPDEQMLFVVGGAVHAQNNEYGTTANETDEVRWTLDASLELGGANLFAAFVATEESGASDDDPYGVLVQGGVFVTDHVELIGRYEWATTDAASEDDLSILTVGVNYFWHKHALKWTTDVGYAFNAVGSTWSSSKAGWRTDQPGSDGQIVFRTQWQLLF